MTDFTDEQKEYLETLVLDAARSLSLLDEQIAQERSRNLTHDELIEQAKNATKFARQKGIKTVPVEELIEKNKNKRCKITILPENKVIRAKMGENLLAVLAKKGFFLPASCGGRGDCGKCKVKLTRGVVDGAKPDENGDILSCKARVIGDIEIVIPQTSGGGLDEFEVKEITTNRDGLGVVIDIGTTTVVALAIDLKSGKITGKSSALNAQAVFGADVITRIEACSDGKTDILRSLIVNQCKDLILKVTQTREIDELVFTANTTMLHILWGENPQSIGVSPFTPVFTKMQTTSGKEWKINAKKITLLPSVSGYIGADIVCGIIATNLNDNELLIDIGTNGEIALNTGGKMYATSTATGPAFEGACIECGSGGVNGAINKVELINGKLSFNVIGNEVAKSICGSGLIDLMAILLKEGVIDETGALDEETSSPLALNIKDDKFYLTDYIYISQADIRQVQLAKSAVKSGVVTLLYEKNVDLASLKTIYIAGGLGRYINENSALAIGLFPKQFKGKIKVVGNTALAGARECMLDENKLNLAQALSTSVEIVELAFSPKFQEEFVNNMYFE